MMQCKQCTNTQSCPCSYPGCPRHGKCCECIAYHREHQELPACYFTAEQETTYDRRITYYIRNTPLA